MSDHLFPFKILAGTVLGGAASTTTVGIPMDRVDRLESIEYQCSASTKIEVFGSPDGVSLDVVDTAIVVAATGAQTKPEHTAMPNMTAPWVIFKLTDLGAGGTIVKFNAIARENITPWGT